MKCEHLTWDAAGLKRDTDTVMQMYGRRPKASQFVPDRPISLNKVGNTGGVRILGWEYGALFNNGKLERAGSRVDESAIHLIHLGRGERVCTSVRMGVGCCSVNHQPCSIWFWCVSTDSNRLIETSQRRHYWLWGLELNGIALLKHKLYFFREGGLRPLNVTYIHK